MTGPGFHAIEELIEEIRNGKMVILVDDEDRENEGDLVLAADHVTPQAINFMALEARGLVCLTLSPQQTDRLNLRPMVSDDQNFSSNKTAFTVSIEAATGVSTGISAADRAHTIRVAASSTAKPTDIHMPGHIFPIRAQAGGVLKRAGHTEGSVDLARLAGLNPAAVICEVMNADGTMARVGDLRSFAVKHKLKIGTIVDLIQYRLQHESLVEEIYAQPLPARFGDDAQLRVFRSKVDGCEHLVLQKGEILKDRPVLVRVGLDHFTRDVFNSLQTGESSVACAWKAIEEETAGLVVILRGNNRDSVVGEVKAMLGEDEGSKPVAMDDRDYGIGAQILRACGVHKLRLLSNHPERRVALKAFELEIVEIVPLDLAPRMRSRSGELAGEQTRSRSDENVNEQEKKNEKFENRTGHKPLQ